MIQIIKAHRCQKQLSCPKEFVPMVSSKEFFTIGQGSIIIIMREFPEAWTLRNDQTCGRPWEMIKHVVTRKEIILNNLVICTHSQVQIMSNPPELPVIVAVSWTTLHLVILGRGAIPQGFPRKKQLYHLPTINYH